MHSPLFQSYLAQTAYIRKVRLDKPDLFLAAHQNYLREIF